MVTELTQLRGNCNEPCKEKNHTLHVQKSSAVQADKEGEATIRDNNR